MEPEGPQEASGVFLVTSPGDVYGARREARRRAEAVGFGATASEEIALVVSELASNVVKHARGGEIRFGVLEEAGRTGLSVEAVDGGPGIADAEEAARDGFTTAGTLGYGLGTVHRLMDEVEIHGGFGAGTHVQCVRWLRRAQPGVSRCPLAFGVMTRPHPKMEQNGDAFVIKSWEGSALVGVIDGLGHGHFALRAAQTARAYVERHFDQSLDKLFQGTHRACRATRGVVMALARIDCGRGTLHFASVGNIEARLYGGAERVSLIVRRGVVGLNLPSLRVGEHPWGEGSLLVLHSDGLSTRWSESDFPGLTSIPAPDAARRLFRQLEKENDDATVLVVKGDPARKEPNDLGGARAAE